MFAVVNLQIPRSVIAVMLQSLLVFKVTIEDSGISGEWDVDHNLKWI